MTIRRLTPADTPAVLRLCDLAGWNQTAADVRRLLAADPDGGFAADAGGRVVGTATATAYGPALGWVGMVLVDPEFRRRGLATALTAAAVGYLRGRGVGTVKLDATPAGRPVYERLGFVPEGVLERWGGDAPAGEPGDVEEATWEDVAAADRAAFGADRGVILRPAAADSPVPVLVARDGAGYALARPGARAWYAGPVVAADPAAARRLLGEVFARLAGRPVVIDVRTDWPGAADVVQGFGLARQRELLRMRLGPDAAVGRSDRVFAIAGPEVG